MACSAKSPELSSSLSNSWVKAGFLYKFLSLLLFLAVPFLLEPRESYAHDAEVIRVKVRAVSAKNNTAGALMTPVRSDPRIDDLQARFAALAHKYDHYELSCSKDVRIEMDKKTDIKLSNGHVVSIRPMHHSSDHLLRVKWTSPSGMKLLDTRLRFDGDHKDPYAPVLAGAELSDSEGVILAIEILD
jgi:hypothetical protein